jgi:hypothetical protein
MQVYGTTALASSTAAPVARRTAGGTFTVASEAAQTSVAAGSVRTLTGIDTLLALQGVEDPTERRRRAVKRARAALDALDELKLGLLSGDPSPATLRRLQAHMADIAHETGDPRLDGVLSEIALRVGVELAKAGIR